MKTSLLTLFLLLSVCLDGQVNFQISQMTNPNPPNMTPLEVVMIGDEAFVRVVSGNTPLYHNGSQWLQLSGQSIGPVSGIKKSNGDLYALTMPSDGFYSWNNTTKSWESAGNRPWGMFWGNPSVVSDTSTWWISKYMSKGELWHYDGVDFTKKLSDTLIDYSLPWANSQGVWMTFYNYGFSTAMAEYGLVFYDGTTLHHLCDFPPDRGSIQTLWTNDGQLFFIHTVLGD